MAAFIDENMNIPISIHLFCMLALRMLRRLLTFPISFAETERSCSFFDGSCIPCYSILVMTQQVSLCYCSLKNVFSHHFLFGVDPPACCFQLLLEHFLVDSLENIRLLILSRVAPVSWMLFRLVFFHRFSLEWPDTPNSVKRCPYSSDRAPPGMVSLSPSESLRSESSFDLFLTWRSAF